jgi:Arc/MetJ family transcription regulator
MSTGQNPRRFRGQNLKWVIHKNVISLHIEGIKRMRTNIDIDDRLMRQAMRSSRSRTKRAVVEEGLRLLIQTRAQATIRRLRGKIRWNGDLHKSRLARLAE